ncbi:MAG: 2,5-diamino-6-(ribosylamino)-4(3H)-pyrimidinone 5'-phosphate reductase [Nitrosopumilus sp. H8]|nr:MAG: 2,5-diamino-6-(ribosylamino)-4(3H)-pyrimidinone 5'-phosphate reductase [Nitrosopumilus sp. H13]RNJ78940.1 MAG: 2,5-diamino-6-(ribosylamino)-4(3H)-pyrimidinone 5'-phosphate reductase [Nitrosopumilus sp. H8]
MEKSRPRVIIGAAASVDGRIATSTGDSCLSSRADLVRLHRLRAKVDAILVGRNTVVRDDPLLTVRRVRGKNPTRIILDSAGRIPSDSKIMRTCGRIPTIIAVSQRITKSNLARLQRSQADVIMAGRNKTSIRILLKRLAGRGIESILVEGGGTVNWEFIRTGLFDEMFVTVSPVLIGDAGSVPLASGRGPGRISDCPTLRLKQVKRLKNHLVLRYVKD